MRLEGLEDRRLLAPLLGSPPAETSRRELVIVDVQLPDYRQLLGGLNVAGTASPEVVLLDSHTDGVLAIHRILSERSDLDAVHIFSHGEPGAVQ
jgi:hypothetical protein